jgi:hypothetical protein
VSGCRVASRAALACAHENRRISGECLSTLATKVLCITQSPFPSGGGPGSGAALMVPVLTAVSRRVESGARLPIGCRGACRVVWRFHLLPTPYLLSTLLTNDDRFGSRR